MPGPACRLSQRPQTAFPFSSHPSLRPIANFLQHLLPTLVAARTDVPISKASLQLDAVLQSPQGQRVTKPQPFALRAELRPKSCVLSQEDLDLIEARDKAFR